jgi:23S rRNA U2552 (ribose-2'-O)-methylase RlmE/FtsJ
MSNNGYFTGANQRWPEFHSWVTFCKGLGVRSYVELGCGSADWLRYAGAGKIITVDLLPNGLANSGIPHVQANSHDPATREHILTLLGGPPDVVFIDADHEAPAVLADFELWYPVARLAVGFHDIRMASVYPAWINIARRYPSLELVAMDVASANDWQRGSGSNGDVGCGGIGVVLK